MVTKMEGDNGRIVIVREMRQGETLPWSSTLALLCGVTHTSQKRAKSPPRQPISRGRGKSNVERKEFARLTAEKHFHDMKRLLTNRARNKEISDELGISISSITKYIGMYPELRELSDIRQRYVTGRLQAAIDRFKANEVAIRKAMEEEKRPIAAVSKEFKFDHRVLRRLLKRGSGDYDSPIGKRKNKTTNGGLS